MQKLLGSMLNRIALAGMVSFLCWACGSGGRASPQVARPPDFQLEDVNPASPSYGRLVSPTDVLGEVSGWYFGHSA